MRMLLSVVSLILVVLTGSFWMTLHVLERGKFEFIESLPIVIIFAVIGTFCIEMGRD
jgi:hypothetical protein